MIHWVRTHVNADQTINDTSCSSGFQSESCTRHAPVHSCGAIAGAGACSSAHLCTLGDRRASYRWDAGSSRVVADSRTPFRRGTLHRCRDALIPHLLLTSTLVGQTCFLPALTSVCLPIHCHHRRPRLRHPVRAQLGSYGCTHGRKPHQHEACAWPALTALRADA